MTPQFLTEVETAYSEAVRLQPDVRREFLSDTYGDRPDVVREVESLLEHQREADLFDRSIVVAAATEMLQDLDNVIGCVVGGRYVIRRCIGKGATAEVYLADHITLQSPFALKRPLPALRSDPDYRNRFLEEARRAVLLKHDNVAHVHDVINEGPDIFVVMEHVEGETLRTRMNKMGRPFTVSEFLPIAVQCVSALAAAHEKRIVHLDVKPENIMLTPAGRVKICDFGIARRLSPDTSNDTILTSDSHWTFAGTPAYMAPEVILSQHFDERADLFSLGTVFCEMLSGRNPFLAETVMATTARVVSDTPRVFPDQRFKGSRQTERIVTRLLAKNPQERYATAELVKDLEALRRSHRRFHNFTENFREAFNESLWLKLAAVAVVVCLAAAPPAWIYRDRIELWSQHGPLLPATKIVVVFPLRVSGDDTARYYFDGLTEVLTARLTQLLHTPHIQVVPARDVRSSGIVSPKEARTEWGANLAIDGSIRVDGSKFRIVLLLVDTQERKELRASRFMLERTDALVVQDRITEAAIQLLEVELGPTEQSRLSAHPTRDSAAYELYLQGLGYLFDRSPNKNQEAIELFRRALALDPSFSLAYAGLGRGYWAVHSETRDPRLAERAQDACEHAVNLGSTFAGNHTCLGTVYYGTGKYQAAVEQFMKAVELDPLDSENYPSLARGYEAINNLEAAEAIYVKATELRPNYWSYIWLANFYLYSRSQYDDALKTYQRAIELAPDNPIPYYTLAAAYAYQGQYEEGIKACQKSIAIRETEAGYINLGGMYFAMRQFPEAARAFLRASQLNPRYYKAAGHLARAYYWIPGKRAEGFEWYAKAISLANEELKLNPFEPDVHIMMAWYYAMSNDRDQAFSHLQIALTIRPKEAHYEVIAAIVHNQFSERVIAIDCLARAIAAGYSLSDINAYVELDNLREDARFRALLATQNNRRTQ